jgi:hypothetical protein
MNWIKQNKRAVAGIVVSLLTIFFAVAELTGTKTDDKIADKLKAMELKERLEAIANEPDVVTTNAPGHTQ